MRSPRCGHGIDSVTNSKSLTSRRTRADNAARWVQQQVEQGAYRLSVLLPPAQATKLRRLAERFGSNRAAVIAAIEEMED